MAYKTITTYGDFPAQFNGLEEHYQKVVNKKTL